MRSASQSNLQRSGEPLVSVIIPVYNGEAFIAEAVDSVLGQDYANAEILVVDDGSNDGTLRELERYGERLRVLTQPNSGPAVARNRGLSAARGAYVAFLDADDVWLPGKLREQVAYLDSHPDVGLVFARWYVWPPGSRRPDEDEVAEYDERFREAGQVSGWLYTTLLMDCALLTSSVMIRRSVVDQVGEFDRSLLRGQDYDYWLRVSRLTKIHKLPRTLVLYRADGGNIVRRFPKENFGARVLQKAVAAYGLTDPRSGVSLPGALFRRRLAKEWHGFGSYHLKQGDPIRAVKAFAAACRNDPMHLRQYALLAMACLKAITTR